MQKCKTWAQVQASPKPCQECIICKVENRSDTLCPNIFEANHINLTPVLLRCGSSAHTCWTDCLYFGGELSACQRFQPSRDKNHTEEMRPQVLHCRRKFAWDKSTWQGPMVVFARWNDWTATTSTARDNLLNFAWHVSQ